ncbi:caveolin-2 [Erpetoichthys calabaricus]|uniref:Caveolin n=1 Tax=Erpetoichthys calabaricus TaxID=27687 RepID=A0A8C4SGN0_ERPCA|nr:caveolin-2 [Erpetoichthys calabaricus]
MGLEKERSDTRIIMNDDEFNRSFEPILPKKEKEVAAPDRDPHDINSHIKVNFEDVIAEPEGTHSFDKVWVCSHAVFELVKYLLYAFLTTVLAIPLSFVAGIYFAVISAIHIWIVMPCIKSCLMALPPFKAIWKSLVDMFISPFFESMGKCLSSFKINKMQD